MVGRKEFHVHLSGLAITSRNFQVKKSTTSGFQHLILCRAGRCTIPHSHTHSTFAQKRLIKKAIDYPRRRSFLAANQAYEIIKKARKGRTGKEREQDNCTGTKLVKFLAIVLHAGKRIEDGVECSNFGGNERLTKQDKIQNNFCRASTQDKMPTSKITHEVIIRNCRYSLIWTNSRAAE